MVTRDEVVYAFRLILGRDPESEEVISNLLQVENWANLRAAFLGCDEFKAKFSPDAFTSGANEFILASPGQVDVEINQNSFDKLVAHVQATWEALGSEKPHWSVLTNPKFLPEHMDSNVVSFYESGGDSVRLLDAAVARAGVALPANGTAFELGCGVGRVTAYLAPRFRELIACDISQPHLDIAESYLTSKKVSNTKFMRLGSLTDLDDLGPLDMFFSVIVLQHNPPPLIYHILGKILGKIRQHGLVYYQVPVHHDSYNFNSKNYLSEIENGETQMEMHVLPQKYFFKVLEENGFSILDLQRDNWPGPEYASYSVLAQKK